MSSFWYLFFLGLATFCPCLYSNAIDNIPVQNYLKNHMKVQTGPYKTVLKIVPEIDDKISLGSNNFLGRLYKKKTFKTVRDIEKILKSSPIQNSPQSHLSFLP